MVSRKGAKAQVKSPTFDFGHHPFISYDEEGIFDKKIIEVFIVVIVFLVP